MISTRLTKFLNCDHPIISAPMAMAAGGKLAAAVTHAGGLGLLGGGYGDKEWVQAEFAAAGNTKVGCGFITWKLADDPQVLEQTLARQPAALMLSFGNPAPFAPTVLEAGVSLICQVQTLRDAKNAADCGANVIVAQGSEAGGHGQKRATITLVPEIADWLAANNPEVLVIAAGGIADGRGLAASLMLGADGVLMGSRLWASQESLAAGAMIDAAIGATGDDTVRSSIMDRARRLDWPTRYTARVLNNPVTKRWDNDPEGVANHADEISESWTKAWQEGDPEGSNTFVGEATGLINDRPTVGAIIEAVVKEAEDLLSGSWSKN